MGAIPLNAGYDNPETTLVPDFLRGYRVWNLCFPDVLTPVWKPGQWDPGRQYAMCLAGMHWPTEPVPSTGCTCGFYAKYHSKDLPYGRVFGSIKASGRIVMGTIGFRAEVAEIEALSLRQPDGTFSIGKATGQLLSERYGVPVLPSVGELIEQFPAPDISGLVDTRVTTTAIQWRSLPRPRPRF